MPKALLHKLLFCALLSSCLSAPLAQADTQTKYATEQRFQELFITAGYSTAFGAALGAAALGLSEQPREKLQYVAMGASVGFILGSAIGTYVIITPMFSYESPRYGAVSPPKLTSVQAQWLLAEF